MGEKWRMKAKSLGGQNCLAGSLASGGKGDDRDCSIVEEENLGVGVSSLRILCFPGSSAFPWRTLTVMAW
jgi:hypothetical protein